MQTQSKHTSAIKAAIESQLPILTPRLIMRKLDITDANALFANYGSDLAVTHYTTWSVHTSVADTISFITQCINSWEAGTNFNFCIAEKASPENVIGMCMLKPKLPSLSLGYSLGSQWWNNGYITECVQACILLASQLKEVTHLHATTDPQNTASQRVLEKCGFSQSKTLKAHMLRPQVSATKRDSLLYELQLK